ncbi:hypothetical protein H9Q72_000963 [Fusarium xylarioides]|uniref:Cell division cycle protein 123 n=1 Tax=Fusarium xylarioides TaxID=221167 RepID=A0A9P7LB90_9HYPO|nr:hypothetical protein H9Q70_001145 [Fusarium xylarioides]KAG5773147.1 hypothetical protein H9Q72_000963 [Fusarium xylarioides]
MDGNATGNMRLTQTNYKEVESDSQNVPPTKFNTCFHTDEEIPAHESTNHLSRPSEAPYSFERWLPLVLKTRNLDAKAAQVVKLTRAEAKLLVAASGTSIITGEHNRAYQEDIQEEIIPHLSSLDFPAEGLFMRLDRCSPKDGRQAVPGRLSLHSPTDIILRLITSQRARNEILKSLEGESPTVDLTFLPFNKSMRSEREYRVYCAPETGAISAVSQYCWHKPWFFDCEEHENQTRVVDQIWEGIQTIHKSILHDLDPDDGLDQLLLKQGLSFDVFYDETDETLQLVELNVFGARSGCGSCLFHWINDWDQLYGHCERVEFRVTRRN